MTTRLPHDDEDATAALGRVFGSLHPDIEFDGATGHALYHPQPEHRGNPGWLHGGLAATLLDHIGARTAAQALGAPVVTGTLDLRYRRPVPLDGGPYRLTATARSVRMRTVRVEAAIAAPDGSVMVEARSLFITRPD